MKRPTSTTYMNSAYTRQCAPATEFGAILEKVPTVAMTWSAVGPTPAQRRSRLGSLSSLLVVAGLVAGGWYGWSYWQEQNAPPLPEATAAYVQGTGVDYTSPVTGVTASFSGTPIETQIFGAPAAVFSDSQFTMLVAEFADPITEDAVSAVVAPYTTGTVRVDVTTVGTNTYAAVVGGTDVRSVDAIFARFTDSLRLPGGATL